MVAGTNLADRLVKKDPQDQLVQKVQPVQQDLPDKQDNQDLLVQQDLLDQQDPKDLMVLQEQQGHPDLRVHKVRVSTVQQI
jgi:hypothetical protein